MEFQEESYEGARRNYLSLLVFGLDNFFIVDVLANFFLHPMFSIYSLYIL